MMLNLTNKYVNYKGTSEDKAVSSQSSIIVCPLPRHVLSVLFLCIGFLVIAGLVSDVLLYLFGYPETLRFHQIFGLDVEANIPTWFSSILLFSNAILLGLIGMATTRARNRWRWHWNVLAIMFVMLSLDETARLHELSMGTIRNALDVSGILYFAWVIPAAVLLLIFAIFYARFILALPGRTRWLFVLAGCIYVAGAMGGEMIGGAYFSAHHQQSDLTYALLTSTEETLEMVGLAVFFYALTNFIGSNFKEMKLRFKD